MNNEKYKKLAHRLLDFFPEKVDGIQEVYEKMSQLSDDQKEYFTMIGPEGVLKITIYVYCLINFYDLKLGDKMIDNFFFFNLVIHEGNYYQEECKNCDGVGSFECDYCNGSGNEECDHCDGSGNVTCNNCEGDGTVDGEDCDDCNGTGETECPYCGGDGEESCDNCNGSGNVDCDECETTGEIYTDEMNFEVIYLVSWDKQIQKIVEKFEDEIELAFGFHEFNNLYGKYIKLYAEDFHKLLKYEVETEEGGYFVTYSDDNPKLKFTSNMKLMWAEPKGYENLLR